MKWLMRILGKENRKRDGFTLVELMVVIIIVGVLAAAAVPIYSAFVKRAYITEAKASIGTIRAAEEVYWAENSVFLSFAEAEGGANLYTNLGVDVGHNTWWKGTGVTYTVVTAAVDTTLVSIQAAAVAPASTKIAGITVLYTLATDTWLVTP